MSYNKILDKDVKQIRNLLINIVEETKNQYALTFRILQSTDSTSVETIWNNDKKINDMQNDFTRMALWKIVKQKMVASDLRLAVGGILISREIERIADVAKHVCRFLIEENITKEGVKGQIKVFQESYEYISTMFEWINTILNLIASIIDDFDEDHHTKVLQLEKTMFIEINVLISNLSKSVPTSSTPEAIVTFIKLIRQLKNLERASECLISIEEILQFIRSGSFEELEAKITQVV